MDKFLNRKDYINKYKKQKEEKNSKKVFIDQKQRLKKELNSISSFTINSEDIKINRKRMTREETKKKKKIDKILKEFTKIDKNSTYLREDTNLNLLKNMDKVKKYSELKKKKEKSKVNVKDSTLHLLLKEEKVKKTNEIGLVPTLCKDEKILIDKKQEQQEINQDKPIKKDLENKKDTFVDYYLDEKDNNINNNNINNDVINNKNDYNEEDNIIGVEKELIELEKQNLNEIKTEILESNKLVNVSKNLNKTLLFFLILFFVLLIILFILLKYSNV